MSNLLIALFAETDLGFYIVIAALAALAVIFGCLWRRERQRSARRLNGMREWREIARGGNRHNATEWREIAFHHAREKKAEAKRTKFFEDSCGRLLTENQDLAEQFRHLVVFIWGEPPLDRSVSNVIEFIVKLRADRQANFDKAVKLTAAYAALSDKTRETASRLVSCGAENQKLQEDAASMARQIERLKWAVLEALVRPDVYSRWQSMETEEVVREILLEE